MIWDVTAALIGAAMGILFHFSWRLVVLKRGKSRDFYRRLSKVLHSMLTDQNADFIRLYKTLLLESTHFIGIQTLGIIVCLLPLFALFWLGGPTFHSWRNSQAAFLTVFPDEEILLHIADEFIPLGKDGRVPIAALRSQKRLVLRLPGGEVVSFRNVRANHVICPGGSIAGLLLPSFGFDVSYFASAETGAKPHSIIIRPWLGDANPFWPFLSDQELYFFIGMGIFSMPFPFFRRKKAVPGDQKGHEEGPHISFVDYMLLSIATAAPGGFRFLGQLESRIFRRGIARKTIDRPIFVTGMARSGTTIVLELLSAMPSVATHQYRDFPFVMIPLLWQRFTALFSRKEVRQERPHKDGILITRESPEAFEEPIWQHFFPQVHDAEAIHTIDEANGLTTFAAFYSDHIRKILLIRKGTRYLSKGNYNIARIRYLASLFPDVRFVIPVRHPIEHVWSLVRQNRLFCDYAREDDRIPDYLQAAGHYEFGPQRVPICLREGTCQRILDAWRLGKDYLGYAIQWAEIYRYISEIMARDAALAARMFLLRYEDLCACPEEVLRKVMDFCELDGGEGAAIAASRIKAARFWSKDLDEDIRLGIWNEVREIAELFGYRSDGVNSKIWFSGRHGGACHSWENLVKYP